MLLCTIALVLLLLIPVPIFGASHDAGLEGARREGKLVIYTAMQPEDSVKLIELYRSRYPSIDASFFRAGSAPLMNRILTENRAGRFLFDVVSGKASDLLLLQKKGLLEKIVSVELGAYADKFKDKQSRWADIYNNYYVIAYNRQRVGATEVPARWEELLDSRWHDGKIALDPRSYDWFFGMISAWGNERGTEFMRRLNQQNPAFRDGNVLIANLLAAGEFPVAITYAHLIERLECAERRWTGSRPTRWLRRRFPSPCRLAQRIPTRPIFTSNWCFPKTGPSCLSRWAGSPLAATCSRRQSGSIPKRSIFFRCM